MAHVDLYGARLAPPPAAADSRGDERLPMGISAVIWLVLALGSWGIVFGAASLLFA